MGIRISWIELLAVVAAASCASYAAAADEPAVGADWVQLTWDGHYKQRPAWSPNGKHLLYAVHEGSRIRLATVARGAREPRRLTDSPLRQYDGTFSADGERIIFCHVKQSGTQGDVELFEMPFSGGEPKLWKSGGKLSHEEAPAWSPDGKRVAYTSTVNDNQELFVANADGSDVVRVTNDPALDAHPAWSPDSAWLVFATARYGDLEIARIRPDGTGYERLTHSQGLDDYPCWSPDGKTIAFSSNRTGDFDIWLMEADGSQPRNATQRPSLENFPCWSPKGELTFVSNASEEFEIYLLPAARGAE